MVAMEEKTTKCRCLTARWVFGALLILLPLTHNFFRYRGSSKDDPMVTMTSISPPLRQRSVRFIPYPHKTLGSGTFMQCQWETRPVENASSETSIPFLDFTQRNAYTQGICIPPTLNSTLHIFSSAEAIECLSSGVQNRDIKLMLSGDSYMKQLYIGLADILLSTHISDDVEIKGAVQRNEVLEIAQHEMERRSRETRNSSFPFVQYGAQCYGLQPLNEPCLKSINELGGNSTTDYVWIIGTGVHIYRRKNQVNATVQEINNFLNKNTTNRTIFVSPPYYFPDPAFTDQLVQDQAELYRNLLPNLAPENPAHPLIDVYELTRSCVWENCSYDRAHRSRFVNRWKAQLLLNTLCEVQ
jgi:hypothetical protein